jgi:hypothetical protein
MQALGHQGQVLGASAIAKRESDGIHIATKGAAGPRAGRGALAGFVAGGGRAVGEATCAIGCPEMFSGGPAPEA